jgi:hypothetical protein
VMGADWLALKEHSKRDDNEGMRTAGTWNVPRNRQ